MIVITPCCNITLYFCYIYITLCYILYHILYVTTFLSMQTSNMSSNMRSLHIHVFLLHGTQHTLYTGNTFCLLYFCTMSNFVMLRKKIHRGCRGFNTENYSHRFRKLDKFHHFIYMIWWRKCFTEVTKEASIFLESLMENMFCVTGK